MSSKKNCVKSKSDEEAIESSKLAFKATLDRMSSSKMFQERCFQTCSLLQGLNRHQECLKWIGEILSFEALDKSQMQYLVTQWTKCKILTCKDRDGFSNEDCYTIASYMQSNEVQNSKLIDALFVELNCYRLFKKRPPTSEFHVLQKLLDLSSLDSRYPLVQGLMMSLSHAWPDYFHSFCGTTTLSKTFLSDGILWEAKVLLTFYNFLRSYEDSLSKVMESKNNFNTSDSIEKNDLMWFPSEIEINLPNRESILLLSNLLSHASFNSVIYSDEILQCYNVVIIMLDLYEERIALKNTLAHLESLLKFLMEKSHGSTKAALYLKLISIKCALFKADFKLHLFQNAFHYANEAVKLIKNFDKCFGEEETKTLQNKFSYASIESKICLAQAFVYCEKLSDALILIEEISNDDFLSLVKIKSSRSSALASSHFNLLLSFLSEIHPIYSAHPLHNALMSMTTTCMRLDMMCPGICQVLKCFESSNVCWNPYFGKNTKDSSNDMVFQFEHIQHLFHSLYRVANLWLKSGNLRFALLYITDGIIFSRCLCLPEKEILFEALMVELTLMEQNVGKILDELNILSDILNYVSKIEAKSKRLNWCSSFNGIELKNDNDSPSKRLNGSLCFDEEERNSLINSVNVDASSVVSVCNVNDSTSPLLPRKLNAKEKIKIFTHKSNCNCRLCSNLFLQHQQCKLAQYYAIYFELLSKNNECLQSLKNARSFITSKKEMAKTKELFFQEVSSIQAFEIELIACMAEANYKFSNIKKSKQLVALALKSLEDTLSFSDVMINFLSSINNDNFEHTKQSLASNFENLNLNSRNSKFVGTTPQKKKNIPSKFKIFNEVDDLVPDKVKTPARCTRMSKRLANQNVISARREARSRYRKECGPVYSNEEIEKSRPSKGRKKKENTEKLEKAIEIDFEEIESIRENSCTEVVSTPLPDMFAESSSSPFIQNAFNFEKLKCEHSLKKALKISVACCNFHISKTASCLLSLHYCRKKDMLTSSAFHLLSMGTTLRISFHINLKICLKSIERPKKRSKSCNFLDDNQKHYLNSIKNTIELTHPKKIIHFVDHPKSYINFICSSIPHDWTVCLLSTFKIGQNDIMMITQLKRDRQPLHLQLEDVPIHYIKEKFQFFLNYNIKGLKATEKSLWWTQRRNASKLLKEFIQELEKKFLGCHAGVLLGIPKEEKCQKEIASCVNKLIDIFFQYKKCFIQKEFNFLLEIYLNVWINLSIEDKTRVILKLCYIIDIQPNKRVFQHLTEVFESFSKHLESHNCKRGHVILILDKDVQNYPWESLSILKNQSVSRMPSIDILLWQLQLNKMDCYAKANLEKVAYVLNPKGDLIKTEQRFSDWFSSIDTWQGIASRIPRRTEWISYISDYDVFIFCGHGSGSSFMFQEVIARRQNRACALLMGCSSGMLKEHGITEPDGMAVAYLSSGSPCALACLWAVTDKDIDRYLAKCLTEWMNEGTSLTDVARKAEAACKIPILNGSACVVYGIPVRSCKSVSNWISFAPQYFKETLI